MLIYNQKLLIGILYSSDIIKKTVELSTRVKCAMYTNDIFRSTESTRKRLASLSSYWKYLHQYCILRYCTVYSYAKNKNLNILAKDIAHLK